MFYNLRINTDFNEMRNGELNVMPCIVEPFDGVKLAHSGESNAHAVVSNGQILAIASDSMVAHRLVAIAENTSFEETLVHITMQITYSIDDNGNYATERLRQIQESGGQAAIAQECRNLARKFEYEHRGELWIDKDYYDAIDKFLQQNL